MMKPYEVQFREWKRPYFTTDCAFYDYRSAVNYSNHIMDSLDDLGEARVLYVDHGERKSRVVHYRHATYGAVSLPDVVTEQVSQEYPGPWMWDADLAMILDADGNSVMEVHAIGLGKQDALVAFILAVSNMLELR